MKPAQIGFWSAGGKRASRTTVVKLRDALLIVGLCAISTVLICAAVIYLALHKVWPPIAPIHVQERLRVLHRFSLLAAREIRSWR
jgi:CHASE2 domain-containing sensor protein